MNDTVKIFLEYLVMERNYSPRTIDAYGRDIVKFTAYLLDNDIDMLTVSFSQIRDFLTIQLMAGISKRTLKRYISALRHYYDYLFQRKYVKSNPFLGISSPKADKNLPDFMYYDDIISLLEANSRRMDVLACRDQAILELLYASGMRVAEVVGLKSDAIDFKNRMLKVIGKGNKQRLIPMTATARDAMTRYTKELRPQLLMKNKEEKLPTEFFLNNNGEALTTRGIQFILKQVEVKTGIYLKLHPHKFRHTFATHFLDRGADLRSIQKWMGHASLSSTQVYTHVSLQKMQQDYLSAHPRAKKK